MDKLNLMEERGGFTASASNDVTETQNPVAQPTESGGTVSADTAVDTGPKDDGAWFNIWPAPQIGDTVYFATDKVSLEATVLSVAGDMAVIRCTHEKSIVIAHNSKLFGSQEDAVEAMVKDHMEMASTHMACAQALHAAFAKARGESRG